MSCQGPGSTHWAGCECHEAGRDAELATLRERLAEVERERDEARREAGSLRVQVHGTVEKNANLRAALDAERERRRQADRGREAAKHAEQQLDALSSTWAERAEKAEADLAAVTAQRDRLVAAVDAHDCGAPNYDQGLQAAADAAREGGENNG